MDQLLEASALLDRAAELIEAEGTWPGLASEAAELSVAVDVAAS